MLNVVGKSEPVSAKNMIQLNKVWFYLILNMRLVYGRSETVSS